MVQYSLMNMKKTDIRPAVLLLCLTALFLLLPVFAGRIPMGHDIRFHWHRIAHMGEALRQGQFPVRLQPGWYHDFGYPLGVYYPDLFLYPFAALYAAGVPLWICYRLLVACIIFALVLVPYVSFKAIAGEILPALAATCLYTCSMWVLTDLYVRAAIGETLALIFFPLIAAGLVLLMRGNDKNSLCFLVCGLTGLLQSHVISAVLALLFLILYFSGYLLLCVSRKQKSRIRPSVAVCAKTALWTLGINAGFLLPFADFNLRYDIAARHAVPGTEAAGVNPAQWFTLQYDIYGTLQMPELYGAMPQTIGLALLIVVLTGLILFVRGLVVKAHGRNGILSVLLFPSLLLLWMTTSFFPGAWLAEHAPGIYRLLFGWLQFPFRYNTMLTLLLCLLFLFLYAHLEGAGKKALQQAFLCLTLVLTLFEGGRLLLMSGNGRPVAGREQSIADAGEYDDDLYLFYDLDKGRVQDDGLHAVHASVGEISREGFSFLVADVHTEASGAYLDLPVWNYEGYVAEDGGGQQLMLTEGKDHRLRILLPDAFAGEVAVRYREPLLWRLAELVSVLSAVCFLIMHCRLRHPRLAKETAAARAR